MSDQNNKLNQAEIENDLAEILRHCTNEIYIFDFDTLKFAWTNDAALNNLGYTAEEFSGLTPIDIKPQTKEEFAELIQPLLNGSTTSIKFPTSHYRKDGSDYPVEVHLQCGRFQGQRVFVAVINDISERIQFENKIHTLLDDSRLQAHFDEITHLPNRRALIEKISHEICSSPLNKIAVMFIGVDNLKDINDILGHRAGDEVLRIIGERIQQFIGVGYVVRFSGDEFVILLPNIGSQESLDQLCVKLLESIRKPIATTNIKRTMTVSIGTVLYTQPQQAALPVNKLNNLIQQADYALLVAKQSGKNCHINFDQKLKEHLNNRAFFLDELNNDTDFNCFYLVCQPIIDLHSNKIIGGEFLLRWQSGDVVLPPDQFIPILEESDKINLVGNWVLSQINEFISQNADKIPNNARFSFNASVAQLRSDSFTQLTQGIMQSIQQLGSEVNLEMEITESIFADSPDELAAILNELKQSNISISLDDFGTGFSSLSYFCQMPIDTLKIDRSFINQCHEPQPKAILHSIYTLAKQLDLAIIAEGIETEDQLNAIRSLNSQYNITSVNAQGYYFHKPLPLNQMLELFN